jgi:hypothetical protein
MSSLTIKLFDKAYVGFYRCDTESGAPLGYLTPYGEDAAGKKRIATIDRATSSSKLKSVVFENEPVSGFRIADSARRGWGRNGTTLIRIEDPRGFELEISVENVIEIMSENTVINGEIMVPCAWGRDGTDNVLLPITSDPYKDAVKNTERFGLSVNLKTVKPGYKVELRDGRIGTYYGSFYEVFREYDGEFDDQKDDRGHTIWHLRNRIQSYTEKHQIAVEPKKTYIVAITQSGDEEHEPILDKARTVKVARILEDTEISLTEAEKAVNKFRTDDRSYHDKHICFISTAECTHDITLEPSSPSALLELNSAYSWFSARYVFEVNSKFYLAFTAGLRAQNHNYGRHNGFTYPNDKNDTRIYGVEIDKEAFLTGAFSVVRKDYNNAENDPQIIKIDEDKIENWYLPQVEVTSTKTGEKFKTNF